MGLKKWPKKTFSAEFKTKVAIEALKGHKIINELATEFEVHTKQIHSCKKQLLDGSKRLFNGKKDWSFKMIDAAHPDISSSSSNFI